MSKFSFVRCEDEVLITGDRAFTYIREALGLHGGVMGRNECFS